MRYVLILLVFGLCACVMPSLNPFDWGGDSASEAVTPPPPPPPGGATVGFWMDLLIRFGWFGIVLMFVVPGVRVPFVALWAAMFRTMTIPFEFLRLKWDVYKLSKLTKKP